MLWGKTIVKAGVGKRAKARTRNQEAGGAGAVGGEARGQAS